MTCRRARKLILELDADEQPPEHLGEHLGSCARCRDLRARLVHVERNARLTPTTAPDPALTSRIMHAVRTQAHRPGEWAGTPVRLRGWAAGGTVIVASMVAVQFSEVVDWLQRALGPVIDVALGVMLGLALTIYVLVLVGSNLESVRRLLRPPKQ